MELHGQNLIGNDVSADGQDTFHARNLATGDPLHPAVTDATDAEINRALEKAEGAFRIYRQKTPDEIAAFLEPRRRLKPAAHKRPPASFNTAAR